MNLTGIDKLSGVPGTSPQMKPAVLGAIMEHFTSGDPVIREAVGPAHASGDGDNEEIVSQIVELLDTIRRATIGRWSQGAGSLEGGV